MNRGLQPATPGTVINETMHAREENVTCASPPGRPCVRLRNTFYFRMQPWYVYDFGGDSSHFWSYGSTSTGNSWNEYWPVGGASYSLVCISPTSITNSKHCEALHTGIQDYEYLVILRERILELREKGVDDRVLREAEALVEAAAGEATADTFEKYGRGHSANHPFENVNEFAEKTRIEIFELLKKLAAY